MVAQPRAGASANSDAGEGPDLEGWLAAAREGDAEAFERLVGAHRRLLFQIAYHQTGGRSEDALDSCQDCLLAAWRSLARFEGGPASFRAWLTRILINCCRDQQRQARRRGDPAPDQAALLDALPDPAQSPEAYAEQRDLGALLERCLASLSPDHREVILLDQAGFGYAEMAEILETEPGTIKSRMSRARVHMRALLLGTRAKMEPFAPESRSILQEQTPAGSSGPDAAKRSEP